MTTKKNGSKQVAVRDQAQLPADVDMFEQDAGTGFEHLGMDDVALPFLVILQKMSPQVDPDNPKYVKGAAVGSYFNTATLKLYGEKVSVVPVHYERKFCEWVPREAGGGFRGHHQPESQKVATAVRDDRGRFVTPEGNHLMDTRYHFVIVLGSNGSAEHAVLALSSTQIKASRLWMTAMSELKLKGKDGKSFTPPMFSHVYELKTVTQSNDQGTWKGVSAELSRPLTVDEIDLYSAAKKFREQIASGKAKVDESQLREFNEVPLEEEAF
jgi:hypothetical protein